jgi:hypothetical protein
MSVDTLSITDIIFNHIEEKHKYPIENVKLLINKFDLQNKEISNAKEMKKIKYFEEHEKKRIAQNDAYEQYVKERKVLYDEAMSEKSISSIQNLINFKFQPEYISDIYTYNYIEDNPITREPKKQKPDIKTTDANTTDVKKPDVKKPDVEKPDVKKPDAYVLDEEKWVTNVTAKHYKEDREFWNKSGEGFLLHGSDINDEFKSIIDKEDAMSLQKNTLVTGSIINAFLESIKEESPYSKEYVILKSEFYTYILDIINQNEDKGFEVLEANFMTELNDKNRKLKIIIPINVSYSHWIMAMIDPVAKKIHVIDPYQKVNEDIKNNIMTWWKWYANKFDLESDLVAEYKIANLPLQPPKDAINCGVFVCMYIYYLMKNNKFPIKKNFSSKDSKELRKFILNNITTYFKKESNYKKKISSSE